MAKAVPGKKTRRLPVVRPLARRLWLRGPAWLEGEHIVTDPSRATPYQPLADASVGIELARVMTAADAVAFATRFGLLVSTPDASDSPPARDSRRSEGTGGAHLRATWVLDPRARETVSSFLTVAEDLRSIIQTAQDVRAATDGAGDAIARLRAQFDTPMSADGRSVLIAASDWVAWRVSVGLAAAVPYVYDRCHEGEVAQPGQWGLGIMSATLKEVCYFKTAMRLIEGEPVGVCAECRRVFVVRDGRQRFCSPAHASKFRFRTFKERHPHGKARKK